MFAWWNLLICEKSNVSARERPSRTPSVGHAQPSHAQPSLEKFEVVSVIRPCTTGHECSQPSFLKFHELFSVFPKANRFRRHISYHTSCNLLSTCIEQGDLKVMGWQVSFGVYYSDGKPPKRWGFPIARFNASWGRHVSEFHCAERIKLYGTLMN